MKKILKSIIIASIALVSAGCNYLDIVPDNTVELSNLFETKEKAYRALTDVYSYFPDPNGVHSSYWLCGDEWSERLDAEVADNRGYCPGSKVMRDWSNPSSPILGYWDGSGKAYDLYEGIRIANIVLDGLNPNTPDMTIYEYNDWIAQIKVLKAYYHFFLLSWYGPIIIADTNCEPNDPVETVRRPRATIDECFNYIIGLLESVLYNEDGEERTELNEAASEAFFGQVDRVIAKALLAKVKVYRASPLFNGNTDFATFKNQQGVNYFNQEEKAEYWTEALEAVEAAIAAAEKQGKGLYEFKDLYPFNDADIIEQSPNGALKYTYNLRYLICEAWNKELVWGWSNYGTTGSGGTLTAASQFRSYASQSATNSYQWLSASLNCLRTFYTKNGVPTSEDKTWYAEDKQFELTTMPTDDYHSGLVQPGEATVNFHLNREPRYYAWIYFDRSRVRAYNKIIDLKMRSGEEPGGNKGHITDYYWTGIGPKKLQHPKSQHENAANMIKFPLPLMRMADLYLLRAECELEANGMTNASKIYADLNKVRARAGLPKIEDVWSNSAIVNTVDKHKNEAGLREIIQMERMIELMFEGQQYFDVRRWKRGVELFNDAIEGFNAPDGAAAETFNQIITWQPRVFQSPKHYLNPIPQEEVDRNPAIDQNPGY